MQDPCHGGCRFSLISLPEVKPLSNFTVSLSKSASSLRSTLFSPHGPLTINSAVFKLSQTLV
jgi:hypothetical protein